MKYSEEKNKKTVAVCMARFNGNYQMAFVKSFAEVCKKHNINMFIFSSLSDFSGAYDIEAEAKIYELMDPKKYDAVVVLADSFKRPDIARKLASRIVKSGIPCISLLADMKGCINLNFKAGSSFEQVVRHIIEHHKVKNVNFISGIRGNSFAEERLAVFRKVMAENGLTVEEDRIAYGDFWEIPTAKAMDEFLASGKKIDAIICANDFMAIEVCRKLREAGLRVPEDVLVSGFDGIELEKYHYPRLATAFQDTEELTEKVAELVDLLVKGEPVEESYDIGCKFRAGQSCGCVSLDDVGVDIRAFGVKSYEAHHKLREREASIELLYEEQSALGNKDDFDGVWGTFYYCVQRFFDEDFFLGINDDFLDQEMELLPYLKPYEGIKNAGHFTKIMRMAMYCRDGIFINKETIERKNLFPDIDRVFNDNKPIMFVPMIIQSTIIGYAAIRFAPEDLDFFMLLAFIKNISQIVEQHKIRQDEAIIFSTDHLTGLLNRKGFYNRAALIEENAIKNQKKLSVISIDMNGLKTINDTYGHKEGDFALSTVGRILRDATGDGYAVTRLGGDEFAIAFIEEDEGDSASNLMGEIRMGMKAFNKTNEKPYKLEAGMGAVTAIPDEPGCLERFLTEADKKMYKNKSMIKKRAEE